MIGEKKYNRAMAIESPWEEVLCNLCSSNDFRILYKSRIPKNKDFHSTQFLATIDKFGQYGQIVQCRSCHLVYANPRLSSKVLTKAYQDVVDPDYTLESESRSINAYFCLSSINKYVQQGSFLDIGCANGYFMNAARLRFDVHGIEPSKWARDYIKEKTESPRGCKNT